MIFKINVTAVSEINQRLARALMLLLLIYSHIDRWISSLGPLQSTNDWSKLSLWQFTKGELCIYVATFAKY